MIDVFGSAVGISSSALWLEVHRAAVEQGIARAFGPEYQLIWRRSDGRLQQDGWVNPAPASKRLTSGISDDDDDHTEDEVAQSSAAEAKIEQSPQHAAIPPTQITEGGIKYLVQPHIGQKTVSQLR